jgi:adenine-specific DNA-methyltransferase
VYKPKVVGIDEGREYKYLFDPQTKSIRPMREEEYLNPSLIPAELKPCRYGPLTSQGATGEGSQDLVVDDRPFSPGPNHHWKLSLEGMKALIAKGVIVPRGKQLSYPLLLEYNPLMSLTDIWDDTKWGFDAGQKQYVVETNPKVVQRCVAMTTDPGDLVFDPTCGSGTTAFSAERLGRRWITCDTSRVAINVARQRLLSGLFDHYRTRNGSPSSGFPYRTQAKQTLKSLAYELEPEKIELVDQPEIDPDAVRVTGPFEAMTIGRYSLEDWKGFVFSEDGDSGRVENYIAVIARLYRPEAAMSGSAGVIHAVVETEKERVAISVGPIAGRVTARQIHDAAQEASAAGIREVHVLGWAFEPNVGEIKEKAEDYHKVQVSLAMIRPDVLAEGLKIAKPDSLFSPLALPDVEVVTHGSEISLRLQGVAVFDRKDRATRYMKADSGYVSAWYLDEDYDGDCFVDCQMFFDFKKKLTIEAALGIDVADEEWTLRLESDAFKAGKYRRIAARVVDVYGNESTVVKDLYV